MGLCFARPATGGEAATDAQSLLGSLGIGKDLLEGTETLHSAKKQDEAELQKQVFGEGC